MSAIWGLWHRDGQPLAREVREPIAASLSAYGTDRAVSWSAEGIAVGCALASALPEDTYDRQPLVAGGDSSVLVADLRIDNRADLLRELGICAGASDKMADSSLLQTAWMRWGEDCVGRLIGDFALAIWDPRNRRIICARDHFGRRPLHYIDQGPLFAFASFPKGLYALPNVRPVVDETMIAMRLALLPEAGERSFFRNIHRLPPGHLLVAGRHGVAVRPYWRPDPERRITFSKDTDYVENFRALFDEAVRCRLRSAGPVGSMLSGGFDSGSVSAAAAGLLAEAGKPLTAFTSVPSPASANTAPRQRFGNESHHAAAVAAFYPNVKHVLVEPAPACILDLLGEFRLWRDMPESLPAMAPYRHAMAVAIQQQGIRTVLSGAMGNITISYDGLSLLPDLIRRGKWVRWAREAAALKQSNWMRLPGLLGYSFGPFVPRLCRSRFHAIRSLQKHSMIHSAFVSSAGIAEMAEAFDREMRLTSRGHSRHLRAAAFVRRDKGSGNSGASITGVDSRDPTADKRLAEFCLAIPDEQFLRNGQRKYLLRRAFAERLPPMILEERRKGMTGADWHLRVAPYRDRFAEAVERVARSPIAQTCLDIPRMRRLIDRWPRDDGWSASAVVHEYRLGLCRGLSAGDFICWVESGARQDTLC
jgi:asparagine synthase (glutamine-hydrolysing)